MVPLRMLCDTSFVVGSHVCRGRALNTGPLRKVAQKYVKKSWHGTIQFTNC